MASLCMPVQTQNYQQFQLTNVGNNMLLQHNSNSLQQHTMLQQQHQHHQQQLQQQHIAPKVLGTSNLQNIQPTTNAGPLLLPKKKYGYSSMPYPTSGEQLPSVARRNARERNRVKQVNNGFVNLRQHIPQAVINALSSGGRGASKKLSKVDTLRIAVEYIRGLQDLLDDAQPENMHLQQQQQHHTFHSDDSSNDGSYAYSSMGSPEAQQYSQLHTFHSELSASPTPSYSDSSDVPNVSASSSNNNNNMQFMQHIKPESQEQQFKFEPFDSFSDEQPDDEELLDYISSWQEQ